MVLGAAVGIFFDDYPLSTQFFHIACDGAR